MILQTNLSHSPTLVL